MDKIALIALKKSGAPDISAAIAAKEAAQAAQEAAETAQGKAEDAAEELEGALEDIEELQSDVSTLQEDTSDLKSQLSDVEDAIGFKNLKATLITDLYVDDGGFVGTKANSQIALIDISELTSETAIHVIISGTHNRCRLLFTETDISEVVSGTTGTYKDKGSTTTEFDVNYEEYHDYKTLIICTNYQQTPYANVKAYTNRIDYLNASVDDVLDRSYCKNLVGQDTTIYYPVYIPANTPFIMSTADGQPVGVNNINLIGYNEKKEDVTNDGWNFNPAMSSRMVSQNVDIYYLRWTKVIDGRPFQVELGNTATEYQEYFPNPNVIDRYTLVKATEIFNAEPYTGTYDWQTSVVNYGKLFKGKANVEAFAFFTDPHVLGFSDDNRNETKMENYLKRVQKVYNSTPCSFIVSGGDWLNNATTMDEACYRLGYLKGIADHLLDGCKLVLGNHDTNYQGKLDSNSELNTGRLNDSTIAAILFRDTDTKKAYYSFDGANSKCYVLDTGIEHNTMLAYDWEQISWLASKLIDDDAEHAIIFLHIINETSVTNPYIFPATCGNLVEAYNNHTTITLNSVVYDFTSCTGHVDFWVAGHNHTDSTGTLGGIPYFITATNSFNSDVPLIDLVLVDYDAGTINLVRVGGTGSDRVINM